MSSTSTRVSPTAFLAGYLDESAPEHGATLRSWDRTLSFLRGL